MPGERGERPEEHVDPLVCLLERSDSHDMERPGQPRQGRAAKRLLAEVDIREVRSRCCRSGRISVRQNVVAHIDGHGRRAALTPHVSHKPAPDKRAKKRWRHGTPQHLGRIAHYVDSEALVGS